MFEFMKRQHERWIWISVTTFLGLALVAILVAPGVLAQSRGISDNDRYFRNFETAFNIILDNYVEEVDPQVLYNGAMKGMFDSLQDPYTMFIGETGEIQSLTDTTSGQFGGVGLFIEKEAFDETNPGSTLNYVRVVAPIEGTPAYKAGIHAGDYVYSIDGVSAEGFTTEEVSNKLRGREGTPVEVTFVRAGGITYKVTLIRAVIEIPTVKYDIINGHIGYLRIIQFTPHTPERTKEALEFFKKSKCDAYIIDVRNNPGGLLKSVIDVANFFFDGGVIVSTKSRIDSETAVFKASRKKIVSDDIPITILIDEGSASASEILTGAMKDRGRATVIGTKSYGKASVQQVIDLDDQKLRLTTAKYLTPDGIDINKKGIEPDILVEEKKFNEEEIASYKKIIEQDLVGKFLEQYPAPSDKDIQDFYTRLTTDGIKMEERYIRMLIKREKERKMDNPPIFDLEFDRVLNRAIEFLEKKK
jgi:carboxyl-terminal processing protease